MIKKILSLVVSFCIVTVIFGVMYVAVQQDFRQSANDPQIQMAEDAAASLSSGGDMTFVESAYSHIDMVQSLQPFILVYTDTGKVAVPSATLQGSTPTPPMGVFTTARQYGEDRVTWQPAKDARIAAVVVPYSYQDSSTSSSGFVLAGRNLREVEIREAKLTMMVFVGWVLSILGLLVLFIITLF